MKKISYYIGVLVISGVALVSFWIYTKYFRVESQNLLVFQAVRGDLREEVNARGEVVPQKEFKLEFPFSGIIDKVLVKEGQLVAEGAPLLGLETRELELERARLQATIVQAEASLAKLLGGATAEEIRVSEIKVTNAERSVDEAQKALRDADLAAFTQAENAVRNTADQFFNNPKSSTLTFNPTIADSQLKRRIEEERYTIESTLVAWQSILSQDISQLATLTKITKDNLSSVKALLFDIATAVNGLSATASVSQTTLDGWKSSVSVTRTAVDTAMTSVLAGEEKVQSAESSLALAQGELLLKKTAPRSEDVAIAESQISQDRSVLALVDEKIRKSKLRAPGAGVIKEILVEEREAFKPGTAALIFASSGYKVESDISELDISKVRYVNGNEASIRFDAFPDKMFKGKVVFIQPQEVIKEGDVYFRTEIFLGNQGEDIRSGMNADVTLHGIHKSNVVKIPEVVVFKKNDRSFVKVVRGVSRDEDIREANLEDREVVTGISDGDMIEVVQGLNEGDTVAVSS